MGVFTCSNCNQAMSGTCASCGAWYCDDCYNWHCDPALFPLSGQAHAFWCVVERLNKRDGGVFLFPNIPVRVGTCVTVQSRGIRVLPGSVSWGTLTLACILVCTTQTYPSLPTIGAQLALGVRSRCIIRMNEKGPCSTFLYQSTQASRMPIIASNLQIWTCSPLDDDMTGRKGVTSNNLYHTSHATCTVKTLDLRNLLSCSYN
jgi:hypothetical protein